MSLQSVSCSPCHRWWQSSVCDWFWTERRADILSSRCKPGTHSAQCPKAWPGAAWHLTLQVNLYVGAARVCLPLLSQFLYLFNFSLKLVVKNSLFLPLTPHLSSDPISIPIFDSSALFLQTPASLYYQDLSLSPFSIQSEWFSLNPKLTTQPSLTVRQLFHFFSLSLTNLHHGATVKFHTQRNSLLQFPWLYWEMQSWIWPCVNVSSECSVAFRKTF